MKTLFVIRHAKSSWKDMSLSDFNRPLNDRGEHNAPLMAKVLKDKGEKIDHIVSSPANRARTTASHFASEFGIKDSEIKFEEDIYHASVPTLTQIVNGLDDSSDHVAIFGHNPGFTYLVEYFTDQYEHMPTCAVAKIVFNADKWSHCGRSTGKLKYRDFPKRHYNPEDE